MTERSTSARALREHRARPSASAELSVSRVTPRRSTAGRVDSAPALPPAPPGPAPQRGGRGVTAAAVPRDSRSASTPRTGSGAAEPSPSAELPPGLGAIDPMQVPLPPELAATIFGWVRRLALQANLAGADRVLRDALADLTSSLTVAIVYPGQDGLWTLGDDDEIPRDPAPIIAVAHARRALIASHTALVPIVTSSEVVAVVMLSRNPRNPGYHPAEQIAAIALARESAAILHHLAVTHLQHQAELDADKGGLYRGEALEAHRSRGTEGQVVNLSPTWVRRTYPMLVIAIVIGAIASIFITVPTYSSGSGVVMFEGSPVNAPAGGTVEAILVKKGQPVKQGQILVKLHSAVEAAELAQATTDYENATIQYLYDQTDEQTKKSLAAAAARVERARAQADTRLVRARRDGTVGDIRAAVGAGLNPNDNILSIVAPGTEPEIYAFLPGKDRPRLRVGMELQVELVGFTKVREIATITSVGTEIVGGEEVMRRILGPGLADSYKQLQGGSFVIVKAKLPSRTFQTEHRTYHYYHGLQAATEVKIQAKPFLVTMLPALEKYLPD